MMLSRVMWRYLAFLALCGVMGRHVALFGVMWRDVVLYGGIRRYVALCGVT